MIHELTEGVEWVSGKIESPKAQEALRKEIGESVLPKAIDQGVKLTQRGLTTTTTILGNFFLTLLLSIFIFFCFFANIFNFLRVLSVLPSFIKIISNLLLTN